MLSRAFPGRVGAADDRCTQRLAQEELADCFGKPQSFISKYERGERRLDVIEFFKVTRHLDANPYHLLKEIDQ